MMRQISNFGDDRNKGWCIFCGGAEECRDHNPSRVFLEKPYPENLPVLPSCQNCNNSFSLDEEYVACLIECAKFGSIEQACSARPKISQILDRKVSLRKRIGEAMYENDGIVMFKTEDERVCNVMVKLAKGHVAFEHNEPQLYEPVRVLITPLHTMVDGTRDHFEEQPTTRIWPEVGSRAMQRVLLGAEYERPWIEVQPGRYRYLVALVPELLVRIVISEYLAAVVVWD